MGVATYPPGATYGPRRLQDLEFVWMIEGDAEYRRDGALVPAPAGTILLCRPAETDAFRWDPARRTRHVYVHFQVLETPPGWPDPDAWPLARAAEPDDILRPMFRYLLAWGARGDAEQARRTLAHMVASFVLDQAAARQPAAAPLPAPVERALAWIRDALEADPSSPVGLADLAEAAGVSREHLCRLFRDATGRTPLDEARRARLDRAAVLLGRSNYSVAQVAEALGYASPFHFSRSFARAFGRSPRDFRGAAARGAALPEPLSRFVSGPAGGR